MRTWLVHFPRSLLASDPGPLPLAGHEGLAGASHLQLSLGKGSSRLGHPPACLPA